MGSQDSNQPKSTDLEAAHLMGRTLVNLDVASVRQDVEAMRNELRRTAERRGRERLHDPREGENTSEIPAAVQQAAVKAAAPNATSVLVPSGNPESVSRDRIVEAPGRPAGVARPAASPGEPSSLARLMVALVEENLPSEPPLYLPALANEPFDGMMGSTLELRIEQTPASERSARADADLSWLGPREVSRALYPNSLGLSDDQVSRLASGLYRQVRPTSEGELAAMVKLARNEAQLVDLFVPIGESFARLYEEAMTPAGEALHAMLDGLGLLSDPEILQALRMWKENRHDPQFWTDDDGRRLKAVRLVGAFVMRKKGEPICALSAPLPGSSGHLERLHGLLSHARRLWLERQSLVRQHFPAQAAAFGASFVVQRGINARPGFFWLEPPEAR